MRDSRCHCRLGRVQFRVRCRRNLVPSSGFRVPAFQKLGTRNSELETANIGLRFLRNLPNSQPRCRHGFRSALTTDFTDRFINLRLLIRVIRAIRGLFSLTVDAQWHGAADGVYLLRVGPISSCAAKPSQTESNTLTPRRARSRCIKLNQSGSSLIKLDQTGGTGGRGWYEKYSCEGRPPRPLTPTLFPDGGEGAGAPGAFVSRLRFRPLLPLGGEGWDEGVAPYRKQRLL
jgi:hypothetical protein